MNVTSFAPLSSGDGRCLGEMYAYNMLKGKKSHAIRGALLAVGAFIGGISGGRPMDGVSQHGSLHGTAGWSR